MRMWVTLASVELGVMTLPNEATAVTAVLAKELLDLASECLEDCDMVLHSMPSCLHVIRCPNETSVMAPTRNG